MFLEFLRYLNVDLYYILDVLRSKNVLINIRIYDRLL